MPYRIPCLGFVLLALAAAPAQAQEVMSGMQIGLAATTIAGTSESSFEARTGLAGGVWFGYQFRQGFGVRQEILYVSKKTAAETRLRAIDPEAEEDRQLDVTLTHSYLELPLLLVYRVETGRTVAPRLFAGPALGLRLDAVIAYRVAGTENELTDSDDSVRGVEFGLVAGAGVDVDTSVAGRLTAGVRFNAGLSNIRTADPPLRHRGLSFFAGIAF